MSAATTARRRQKLAGWLCALAGLALVVAASTELLHVNAQAASQNAAAPPQDSTSQQNVPNAQAPGGIPPGAPAEAPNSLVTRPAASAAIEPQQQVASEAADLLKMATALKSEVDKTTKDTLSVTVVRKASEIEQLAHKVRNGPGKG